MLPGIGTPVKVSGRSSNYWTLEWTYGASGAVTLDSDMSDLDERVTTPVADGGTGVTSIRFPKCRRVRIVHCSVENVTPATGDVDAYPRLVVASTGSMNFTMVNYAGALADPVSGSRGRLTLDLDYQ
jgi:hypothetical protein